MEDSKIVSPNLDLNVLFKNKRVLAKKPRLVKMVMIALDCICSFFSYLIEMSDTDDPAREEAAETAVEKLCEAVTVFGTQISKLDNQNRLSEFQQIQDRMNSTRLLLPGPDVQKRLDQIDQEIVTPSAPLTADEESVNISAFKDFLESLDLSGLGEPPPVEGL